jgi:transcriptional regulator with XRE-family HTH domain
MFNSFAQRLRKARNAARLTQAQLASAVGVTSQAVSQWERGETLPEIRNIPRIAAALGLNAAELIGMLGEDARDDPLAAPARSISDDGESSTAPTVAVVGYVGAGSKAHFYAVAQGSLDEVAAPAGATARTVAVEIRGDSLGVLFDRWLVFYDDVRSPVTADLVGKLCVVGLADDRVLIKRLKRGKTPGTFTLISERDDPITDVAVEWAAMVKNMVPR